MAPVARPWADRVKHLRRRAKVGAVSLSPDELWTLMSWFGFVERAELDTLYDRALYERIGAAYDASQSAPAV